MSDYTPTTQDVREAWLTAEYEERDSNTSDDEIRAEFNRWFQSEIEKAERRGEVLATARRIASENQELLKRLADK